MTSAYQIALVWQDGVANGGAPILDYEVWYDQANDDYTILESAATGQSYIATTLTMGTTYKFKLKSRNAYGLSLDYSNEVSILQAEIPTKPGTPVITIVGDQYIILDWVASSPQGSPLLFYKIEI